MCHKRKVIFFNDISKKIVAILQYLSLILFYITIFYSIFLYLFINNQISKNLIQVLQALNIRR